MTLTLVNISPEGFRTGSSFEVEVKDSDLSTSGLEQPLRPGDRIPNNGPMFSEGWTFEVLVVS